MMNYTRSRDGRGTTRSMEVSVSLSTQAHRHPEWVHDGVTGDELVRLIGTKEEQASPTHLRILRCRIGNEAKANGWTRRRIRHAGRDNLHYWPPGKDADERKPLDPKPITHQLKLLRVLAAENPHWSTVGVTMPELCETMGMPDTHSSRVQLGHAARNLGWKKRRFSKARGWLKVTVRYPPTDSSPPAADMNSAEIRKDLSKLSVPPAPPMPVANLARRIQALAAKHPLWAKTGISMQALARELGWETFLLRRTLVPMMPELGWSMRTVPVGKRNMSLLFPPDPRIAIREAQNKIQERVQTIKDRMAEQRAAILKKRRLEEAARIVENMRRIAR